MKNPIYWLIAGALIGVAVWWWLFKTGKQAPENYISNLEKARAAKAAKKETEEPITDEGTGIVNP